MGFINHCNAALGKTVLSAGRNTLQLTATAGRKTLTSERGFGDRLRMALGYFMAAFLPSGARPQGALPAPFTIFQASFCRQKQTAQGHAREGKERKKLLKEEKGRQNRWGWIAGFLLLHHRIFFLIKKETFVSLAPWKDADFMQVPSIGSSGRIQLTQEHFHLFVPSLLCSHFVFGKLCWWRTSGQGWAQCCSLLKLRGPTGATPQCCPTLILTKANAGAGFVVQKSFCIWNLRVELLSSVRILKVGYCY